MRIGAGGNAIPPPITVHDEALRGTSNNDIFATDPQVQPPGGALHRGLTQVASTEDFGEGEPAAIGVCGVQSFNGDLTSMGTINPEDEDNNASCSSADVRSLDVKTRNQLAGNGRRGWPGGSTAGPGR